MAAADDIKANLDLDQIAQFLGTDRATADRAVDDALDQLVGAMDDNVADADGAVNLTRALGDHTASNAFGGQVDINAVDAGDGEKIVQHVFSDRQMQTLGAGSGGSLLRKLMPILAPLVMSYLANRLQDYLRGQGGGGLQQPQQPTPQPGSGGLGDILGDLLGGGSVQQPQQRGSGGGLGDLLGDLLGGGSAPQQQPRQAPSTGGTGGFNAPAPAESGLRMPEGTPGAPRQQAPAGGGGDVLGSILSDLLRGRR